MSYASYAPQIQHQHYLHYVFFDIDELVNCSDLELGELILLAQLIETLVKKLLDGVALPDLAGAAMARAIPVRERDLDLLVLQLLLPLHPLLPQLLAQPILFRLPILVRQEARVHRRILAEALLHKQLLDVGGIPIGIGSRVRERLLAISNEK